MQTPVTEMFGIEFPIFAFSHCRDVVAADADAGGLEGGGAGQAEDGGAVQFPAFADPHGVEAGTAGHREDPAVPGHAEGLGPGG